MKINIKNKGLFQKEFNEYFKNYKEFNDFINKEKYFININTNFLEYNIKKIYDDFVNRDVTIKSSILTWYIHREFKFRYKSAFKLEFWEERGYGIEEYKNWLSKRRDISNLKSLNRKVNNDFRYKDFKFKSLGEPKCNLCGSSLNYDLCKNDYEIKSCCNDNCTTFTNENIYKIRQLGFLPLKVYENTYKINLQEDSNYEYWLLKGFSYKESLNKAAERKYIIRQKEAKINSRYSIDYWIHRGFSEENGRSEITKIQEYNCNKKMEKLKDNPNSYSAISTTQVYYWINKGYSKNEAKEKVSERQRTFTKEKCIKKYGEVDGLIRWKERQEKWIKSFHRKGNIKLGYSLVSQELFYSILNSYSNFEKDFIFFAVKNKELMLIESEYVFYFYDFADLKQKKIIEFHGDKFHGNPILFNEEDRPHPFNKNITAKEIWVKDKNKNDLAIEQGYEVLVIWETDYKNNKERELNKCLKFLNLNNE